MNEANHTPGPWAIDWNVSRLDVFSSDASFLVASLRRSALSPAIDDAAKANARLIAAAPELLAALIAVVNQQRAMPFDGSPGEDEMKAAIDAINKATRGTL